MLLLIIYPECNQKLCLARDTVKSLISMQKSNALRIERAGEKLV